MTLASSLSEMLAQDDMPDADYVIEGEYIADFQWLPDSTGLRVIDELVVGEQRNEFEYDLETQTAQPSSNLLSTQQLDQLGLLESASGDTSSIVYLSPDKQWVAYGVTE